LGAGEPIGGVRLLGTKTDVLKVVVGGVEGGCGSTQNCIRNCNSSWFTINE
jgi:hypothetical protein